MQYTIKVALLAVTLYGTSARALPSGYGGRQNQQTSRNIERRELDNDLSYRELNEMNLEARTNPSLEAREYLDYLEARDAAVTDAPAAPTELSSKKAMNLYDGLNLKVNAFKDFTKDPKNTKDAKDPTEQAFEVYLKNDTVALDSALVHPDSIYHTAAVKVAHDREVQAHFDEDPLNLDRALKNEDNPFHLDAIKKALSQRDRFVAAYTDENNPLHPMAIELAAKVKSATRYKRFKVAPKGKKVAATAKKVAAKAKTKTKKANKKVRVKRFGRLRKAAKAAMAARRAKKLIDTNSETATSTSSTPTPTSNATPAQLFVGSPNPASSTPTSNLPATQSSVSYARSIPNTPISNPPQAASQSSGLNSASTDSTAASPQAASASYVRPTLSIAAAPVPTATPTPTLKA